MIFASDHDVPSGEVYYGLGMLSNIMVEPSDALKCVDPIKLLKWFKEDRCQKVNDYNANGNYKMQQCTDSLNDIWEDFNPYAKIMSSHVDKLQHI